MMSRILQELRQQMECPICLQHMTPPITLCCNGHSICSACKPGLRDCPICRGNLTNMRTIALETIAGKLRETVISEEPVPISSAESGQSSMDIFAETKLKQLQCCMCKEYMIPPIKQCMQCGAFICMYCNPVKPHKCGNGNQQTILIQNGAAEAISRAITHRCKLYTSGCTGHFHADHKKQHEEVCLFRSVSCPFTIVHPCDWKGPLFNVKEHVKSSHIYHVLSGTSLTQKDCQSAGKFYQVVYVMDNFFFHFAECCHTFRDNKRNDFDYKTYVTCLFIGDEEEAKGFEYTITPYSKYGISLLKAGERPRRFRCQSYYKFNKDSMSDCHHYSCIADKYRLNILKI